MSLRITHVEQLERASANRRAKIHKKGWYPRGLSPVHKHLCSDLGYHHFKSEGAGIWRCKHCGAWTVERTVVVEAKSKREAWWLTSGY